MWIVWWLLQAIVVEWKNGLFLRDVKCHRQRSHAYSTVKIHIANMESWKSICTMNLCKIVTNCIKLLYIYYTNFITIQIIIHCIMRTNVSIGFYRYRQKYSLHVHLLYYRGMIFKESIMDPSFRYLIIDNISILSIQLYNLYFEFWNFRKYSIRICRI